MTSQPPAGNDSATTADPAPSEASLKTGDGSQTIDCTQTITEHGPSGEIGAGILGPDPLPPLTDEERKRMSEGLLEVTAEFQAEHGKFTEEERAWVRARFSFYE